MRHRRPDRRAVARLPRILLACAALAAPLAADAAPRSKSRAMETKPPERTVGAWLALGPAPMPLPVFHGEKPGGVSAEELLKAEYLPRGESWPAEGARVDWFSGNGLAWSRRSADAEGCVALAIPPDSPKRPALAWLATYLEAERFVALDVELTGAHPRRAWLDGQPVASSPEAKGKIELAPGTHLLLVQTVLDPETDAPWSAGAVLRGAKEAKEIAGLREGTDAGRTLDIHDVLDATQITSVAISPDGAEVAVTYSRVVPGTDDSESWLAVRSAANGRAIQTWRGVGGMGQAAWSPGGRRLSYVTRSPKAKGDGDDVATLWAADLDAGTVEPLVERVDGLAGYSWSPDGASVVYTVNTKPEPDKRGVKLHENLLDKQTGWRTKASLYQASYPGGARRRLTSGSVSSSAAAFSPDGKRLLFTRQIEDLTARPYLRDELWELDLDTLEAKKLRDGRWLQGALYAPDGKRLLVRGGPSEFGAAGVNLPAGVVPNESDGQLYVWDLTSGAVDPITREFDPSVRGAVWSRHDGNIYFSAEDRDGIGLWRYEPASRRFARLATGVDVLQETSFAERAAAAAVTGTSPWAPETLHVVDLAAGTQRLLDEPGAARFSRVRKGGLEPFTFRTGSGVTIDGRVYLPPAFDASKKGAYPAIVYYYGGTEPVVRDFGGRYPKEWWASLGYVVYVPNPQGATGYGQAYSAVHVNDWGEVASQQILEGTRKFLEAYPSVDPKRVGCIGASYGGFMTMYLTTHSDLYAAAVSHAGISDLSAYWGHGWWGYSYNALSAADSFPWNRRDIYVDRSPLFSANRSKTPTLLTHGASDTNVPFGESDAFYTALKLVGTPVELIEVEGQDHWILDHMKRVTWSRSIVAWFDRWLKGEPEWWDHLYPKGK